MEIQTANDFRAHKNFLHNTVYTLFEIGLERRARLRRTSMENWISTIEMIRQTPSFVEGMETISPNMLGAYFLSHKMISLLTMDGRKDQYTFFRDILKLLDSCPENADRYYSDVYSEADYQSWKFNWIHKTLTDYIAQHHAELSLKTVEQFIPSLKLLYETYPFVTGLVRSIKSFETPPIEKGIPEDHPCDQIRDSIPIRSMAYVLEHVSKEAKRKGKRLTIEELQNKLVSAGLYFGEKNHPHFVWGTLFTLPQVLEFERGQILAWFLTDKIAKSWQQKNHASQPSKSEQDSEAMIRQDFDKIYQVIQEHKDNLLDPAFYRACATLLHSLKGKRGFEKIDIFDWLCSLKELATIYEQCHKQSLARKHQAEQRAQGVEQEKEPTVTILVDGDSVSAGLRVPHKHEEDRWVTLLEKFLKEKGYPVKVVNCSVAGFETREGVRALSSYLKYFDADIAICPLGGNDANKHRGVFTILNNMVEFVKTCKTHGIKESHVLWGVGIPESFKACKGYRNSFVELLKEFSKITGAKSTYLPDRILAAKNMHTGDPLHFNVGIQKDIAVEALKMVEPMVREVLDDKRRLAEQAKAVAQAKAEQARKEHVRIEQVKAAQIRAAQASAVQEREQQNQEEEVFNEASFDVAPASEADFTASDRHNAPSLPGKLRSSDSFATSLSLTPSSSFIIQYNSHVAASESNFRASNQPQPHMRTTQRRHSIHFPLTKAKQ